MADKNKNSWAWGFFGRRVAPAQRIRKTKSRNTSFPEGPAGAKLILIPPTSIQPYQ